MAPSMRILHILNDVTDRGNGIVNTAVDLAIEQARQGDVVAVASASGGYETLLKRCGVLHFTLDQSRKPANLLRALRTLRRQMRGFDPDVVHAHMRTGLLLAWLWSRCYRVPLVAHLHNVHDRESRLMGLAERVIAVSHSVADTLADWRISKEKIRVVLNRTLGTPRHPALADIVPAALAKPSIVTVGGMSHRKGIAELIAAFEIAAEQFPEAHLYLVGDGPDRGIFEEQARASRCYGRIHFEGFQSDPQRYMLSADIFVLPSRRESFGLVLIEAREAGCAIIASDTDGISEALDNGAAGMLVPPGDVSALADALCGWLADEQERRVWQHRAQLGIDAFHIHAMAAEVHDIYCELVHRTAWEELPDAALRD
jgi:glycosyltransferase involved in cell wall biosynthesis